MQRDFRNVRDILLDMGMSVIERDHLTIAETVP
jgi:hypothetical protein